VLYSYFVTFLVPSLADNKVKTPYMDINRASSGFVTGPENLKDKNSKIKVSTVFMGQKDESFNLVIFRMHDITCMLLVETDAGNDFLLYKNMGSFVSGQLDLLVPILEENYYKKQGFEDQYRYIYFNHMNCALKTSVKEKGGAIPRETMKMLNDIHTDFEKSPENTSEVLIRTQNDRWVVGRKSDQREFYVIFDHKNSHLIEINEEVRKLSSTYFNNIFID